MWPSQPLSLTRESEGGLPMATSSLSSLGGLFFADLLVLVKQTAEQARTLRVHNPCAAMAPEEVLKATVLYAKARGWLVGENHRRAEPKWRSPGDVEAAFFALYDALRSQIRPTRGVQYQAPGENRI